MFGIADLVSGDKNIDREKDVADDFFNALFITASGDPFTGYDSLMRSVENY